MKFYVYAYLRSAESPHGPCGSPYYIGKGKNGRKIARHRKHIHVPTDPQRIVVIAEGLSEKDSFQAEMLLIALYGRVDLGTGCLRNRTDGGEGASGISEESRKKKSEARKSFVFTEEAKKKIGDAHRGNKYRLGSTLSEEAKSKISAAHKGKVMSLDYRLKMSLSCKGKTVTEETRIKMREASKKRSRNKLGSFA